MNYFIKTKNEIVGLFKSYEDAVVYALKKIDIEKLKIYRHNLMYNMEETGTNLQLMRKVEDLMEDIAELDIEDKTNLLYRTKNYHNYADSLLKNTKYPIEYNINCWAEDTIQSFFF